MHVLFAFKDMLLALFHYIGIASCYAMFKIEETLTQCNGAFHRIVKLGMVVAIQFQGQKELFTVQSL